MGVSCTHAWDDWTSERNTCKLCIYMYLCIIIWKNTPNENRRDQTSVIIGRLKLPPALPSAAVLMEDMLARRPFDGLLLAEALTAHAAFCWHHSWPRGTVKLSGSMVT